MSNETRISIAEGTAILAYPAHHVGIQSLLFGMAVVAGLMVVGASEQETLNLTDLIGNTVLLWAVVALVWYVLRHARTKQYGKPLAITPESIRGMDLGHGGDSLLPWSELHRVTIAITFFGPFAFSFRRPLRFYMLGRNTPLSYLEAQTKTGDIYRFDLPRLAPQQWKDFVAVLRHHAKQNGTQFSEASVEGFDS